MLPESPNTELKLAHSANLRRYRPVPKRVIWLAAVLTSAIMVAASPLVLIDGWPGYSLFGTLRLALLPFAFGYVSTMILGIWADVDLVEALQALAIPLVFSLIVACTVMGSVVAIALSIFLAPFALILGVLGVRLGMYSNELRWDRKVQAGLLADPIPPAS